MEKNSTVVSGRNYQIDVLKLILAILVLLCHTFFFVDPDSVYYDKLLSFGGMSVHIFFIISGFLMVKGIDRRKYNPDDAGKCSMVYVVGKFKSIALPCIVSTLIILAGYILINIYIYIYIWMTLHSALIMRLIWELVHLI